MLNSECSEAVQSEELPTVSDEGEMAAIQPVTSGEPVQPLTPCIPSSFVVPPLAADNADTTSAGSVGEAMDMSAPLGQAEVTEQDQKVREVYKRDFHILCVFMVTSSGVTEHQHQWPWREKRLCDK